MTRLKRMAQAVKHFVSALRNGSLFLTIEEKIALYEEVLKCRILSPETQLVWGIDDWSPGMTLVEGGICYESPHVVTVASEGEPCIFSVALTLGEPTAYAYCRAVAAALIQKPQISGIPLVAPCVLVADGCGAAAPATLEIFCRSRGIVLRHTKPHRPWGKCGVERAVHSEQARAVINLSVAETDYHPLGTHLSLKDSYPAARFLTDVIRGAVEFNSSMKHGRSRAELYYQKYKCFGLPFSEADLADAHNWSIIEAVYVVDHVVRTRDGAQFTLPRHTMVKDGHYCARRFVVGSNRSIIVMTDDIEIEANPAVLSQCI